MLNMMRPWLCQICSIGCGLLMSFVPISAFAGASVQQIELDNGFRVFVKQDKRAPVVVSQVWYQIGSSYEHDGITGLSHMLEHMMFKGTDDLKPGEFSQTIARLGGSENAFTGKHYTAYFQSIGAQHLELCLKLEADRMRNLVFDEDEFKRELQVVKEERMQRVDDQPRSYLYEELVATAYLTSPNRHPIIGWENDLQNMTMLDAKSWYQRWYTPNNAALVVVGDVEPQTVFRLAKRYFGNIKANPVLPAKPRLERQQKGERRLSLTHRSKLPYLVMSYKVPSLLTAENKAEIYALDLLADLLDGGQDSRLPKELERAQKLVASVGASVDIYDRLGSLFTFDATPASGKTMQDVEAALLKQVQQIQQGNIDVDELERAKTRIYANLIYQQDSLFYQAMRIGRMETIGLKHTVLDEYLPNVKAVNVDDIVAVAKKYFKPENLSVAYLLPEGESQ